MTEPTIEPASYLAGKPVSAPCDITGCHFAEIASLRSQLTAAIQERDEARVAMNRFFNLGNAAGERAEKAEAALSATEEVVKAARDLCDELNDQVAPRIKAYVRAALSRLAGGGRS